MQKLLLIVSVLFFFSCNKPADPSVSPGGNDTTRNNIPDDETLSSGILYSFGQGRIVTAFDLKTEKFIWSVESQYLVTVVGTNVFRNDTIYYSDMNGVNAIKASDGSSIWYTRSSSGYSASNIIPQNFPVLSDSIIYHTGYGGPEHVKLTAFNNRTGKIIWNLGLPGGIGFPKNFTTPAVVDDKVIVMSVRDGNDWLYCLNRFTGNQIWRSDLLEDVDDYASFPLISNDKKSIYIYNYDRKLLCSMEVATGKLQWSKQIPALYPSSSDMYHWDHKIYFTSESKLFIVDDNGSNLTTINIPFQRRQFSEGKLYTLDDNLLLSCHEGAEEKWRLTLPSKSYIEALQVQTPGTYNYFLSALVVDDHTVIFSQQITTRTAAGAYFVKSLIYIVNKHTGKIIKVIDLPDPALTVGTGFTLIKGGKAYYPTRG